MEATCTRCLAKLMAGDPHCTCPRCEAAYHDTCGAAPCVSKACADRLDPSRRTALAIVLPALFAALTYVLGMLQLVRINLEAKTVTVFCAGAIGGPICGLFTGALTTVLHQLLNPLGMLDLLGCFAQAAAWSIIGVAGSLASPRTPRLAFGALGALLTLLYHLLTDLAGGVVSGLGFWKYFLGGFVPVPFTPIHIATNALLFAILLPPLMPSARRWRGLLS